jgi:Skp family chaperone for outer membrane proteins
MNSLPTFSAFRRTILLALALGPLLGFLSSASAHDVKLKIAEVNMTRLFNSFYRTKEAKQVIAAERKRIVKDNNDRLVRIRQMDREANKLRKSLRKGLLNARQKQQIRTEIRVNRIERTALERERLEFLDRRNRALEEKARQYSAGIYEELTKIVGTAASPNYDYVFDNSNARQTKTPELVYSSRPTTVTTHLQKHLESDGVEITDEVMKILNIRS